MHFVPALLNYTYVIVTRQLSIGLANKIVSYVRGENRIVALALKTQARHTIDQFLCKTADNCLFLGLCFHTSKTSCPYLPGE